MRLGIAIVVTSFVSISSYAGVQEYYDQLDKINFFLADVIAHRTSLACEGAEFVLSCGNGICEPDSGENIANCAADCINSPVKSYDHSMVCDAIRQYFEPTTLSQVQQIINYAINSHVSVRVVGNRHTVNDSYCTDGIAISTAKLNRIIGIIKEPDGSESVVVEPGVVMGDLANWLHARKRSLGYAVFGFRLATVGGAIATAAHGSSPNHTDVISNIVKAITLVDGTGTIRNLSETVMPEALRAARANLGLLGAVVRIKLAVQPQFQLHVKVTNDNDDDLVHGRGIFEQIKGCDFAIINWFPNTNRFVKSCGVQTNRPAERAAENTLLTPPVPSSLTQPYKLALHYGMCVETLNELLEGARYLQLLWIPPFQKADSLGVISSTKEAIGYSHLMMSSALIQTPEKFFMNDWELAVPEQNAQAAIRAVSQYAAQFGIRLPLVGVFLRFAPSEDLALLAHTTSIGAFKKGETAVFFEFPTPVPVGFSDAHARAINVVYEDLARMLIIDFGARPHWGKNKDFAFALEQSQGAFGNNFARFQKVKDHFDPLKLFMTPFDINAGFQ